MTIQGFIRKKRDGGRHTSAELSWFVERVTRGEVPDYQISAWLMATYLNGLDQSETTALTLAMAHSGDVVDLSEVRRPIVDKHSTGGVGDAVTLIFLPLLAACRVTVVKMSGRGLGHTGGTVDKMEAIPGFRTDLSPQRLVYLAKQVGCALGAQTANLAPTDKIFYALRDATETIGSIPLIAASVMSKKLAAGAEAIVLDVKAGNGAFMKSVEEAKELATALVAIGEGAGRSVRAVITDMNQPLAPAIGNALEVKAAIRELQTGCKNRLGEVVRTLAQCALDMTGVSADVDAVISSGNALQKLREWVRAQGGDEKVVDDPDSLLPCAPVRINVCSSVSGYIVGFDTMELGEIARDLGAGRRQKEDQINPAAGIELHAKIGDLIAAGDQIFTVHANNLAQAQDAATRLGNAFKVSNAKPAITSPIIAL